MIKLNDILDVKIEKLAYGGEGIAKVDNFVIFVENAVPKDTLKIKITSLNKHFARAKIEEVLISSPYRIKPFCPIYNACGSCQGQNMEYDFLLEEKRTILKDIFPDFEIPPIIKSEKITNYRRKIQYPTRQTKNSKRLLVGYFKKNSHDITDVKYCPIAPGVMDEISQFIRQNYKESAYCEKTHKGLLRHIVARFSTKDDILITFVINSDKIDCFWEDFAQNLKTAFPQIKGIFLNFNTQKTNKILSDKTTKIYGEDTIVEDFEDEKGKKFLLGPVSFFQVNPYAAKKLFDEVKKLIPEHSSILDCYGGSGAIGIWSDAQDITLIEQNIESIKLAKENYKLNNIKSAKIYQGDAKDFIKKCEGKTFDYAIIDPPRAGCDKKVLDTLTKLSENIIYISCNPQTLKRDIDYLENFNFKTQKIQGVDLFPYTHHIECLCLLKKQ